MSQSTESSQKHPLTRLKGQIERVTFTSDETGYSIVKVKVYGRPDLVACVGTLVDPVPGAILEMSGEWITSQKYGEQFKFSFSKVLTPATAKGIEKYLGSGLIKGIGPVMARRIVSLFGDKTLDVIENEPNRLLEVPGIAEGRVAMIAKAWEEQKAVHEVMVFLQGHGVSSSYAAKIYKQYGDESIKVVQENPYRLARDIFGIGFLTADRIAENMGFAQDSPKRADAGIIYALYDASDEGHVCLPHEDLIERGKHLLNISFEGLEAAIARLAAEGDIVIDGDMVYLAKYHVCERGVAGMLKGLSK
ncbi:MAG: ATP-dependent RecD-like DNA helicase, partial [Mailhella sp.]|nr:ATP-dependent RecD-like DNA helicase [Mailhella sp.]